MRNEFMLTPMSGSFPLGLVNVIIFYILQNVPRYFFNLFRFHDLRFLWFFLVVFLILWSDLLPGFGDDQLLKPVFE